MDRSPPLLVVCLCAQWCGACREYRSLFERISADFGDRIRPVWVDIEDDAALLDGIEVDNFPGLMLARNGKPLFFGAVTPHAQTLKRLVDMALTAGLPPLTESLEAASFLQAISARSSDR